MSSQEWMYYINKKEQGSILLSDLLHGVDSGRFELSTLVKAPQGVYWSEIRKNPEMLIHLPCRYIIDNVIHEASSGKEMLSAYEKGLIDTNTNVRIEKSGEWSWEKLQKSVYWQMVSEQHGLPVFYGYSSLIPKGKPLVARIIDKIVSLFFIMCITFSLFIFFGLHHFHLGILGKSLILIIMCNIPVLLYAGLEFLFLCLFGGTIGARLVGFYILTSKLEKLSFFKAADSSLKCTG